MQSHSRLRHSGFRGNHKSAYAQLGVDYGVNSLIEMLQGPNRFHLDFFFKVGEMCEKACDT